MLFTVNISVSRKSDKLYKDYMSIKENNLDTTAFFDEASSFYDEMIDFDKSVLRRKEIFGKILPGEKQIIADLGSGTGLDAIACASLGHDVHCFDLSTSMLEIASQNASRLNVRVETHPFGIAEIPEEFYERFSIVISTGNTLALIPMDQLGNVFNKIYSMLQKGTAYIQVLNFERILKERERIVAITKKHEFHYIRYYDFHNEYIDFNILRFHCTGSSNHQLLTTRLYPHTIKDLAGYAKKAGFSTIQVCSDLAGNAFDEASSKDVVLKLEKKQ